ncbi:winged helix-turn-helix domain-containing protein [Mesorhizobium escarrei]|uniref:OmpR/PhoB-type domain-containing protein n=1 Tax=Mesorhizobium escarrei TaxID=666018 RepID=A0ABM9EAE2_9HYPH|nr:transcriptional regulator [Mesorhizobium escarrei]CAH2405785.1 conserved hypothetical protein [Mesorhizobium escarrei]
MGASGLTVIFDRLPSSKPAALTQFDPRRLSVRGEVAFGPFRLFPRQFLLLEGDKPVPLGSRALGILIALLERPGELVSKQELMARVWPDIFVVPTNLTVHISTLRRMLRDGRDGNRFIINIPGRGYQFVASVHTSPQRKMSLETMRQIAPTLVERVQIHPLSDSGARSAPTVRL